MTPSTPTPADALRLLVAGNARFAEDMRRVGRIDPERRTELAVSQAPFATVLGCSDSRVPFEHVFDAGIGDVFAIRNAGQIADDVVLGSIEFAVVALGTPLVVVLRHTRCGAVGAACSPEPVAAPFLRVLVDAIAPSVRRVRAGVLAPGGTAPDADADADAASAAPIDPEAVGAAHLEATMRTIIERSGAVSDAIAEGRLAVVGATYDLATGRVTVDTVIGDA
jgi:carbonic anhydrase